MNTAAHGQEKVLLAPQSVCRLLGLQDAEALAAMQVRHEFPPPEVVRGSFVRWQRKTVTAWMNRQGKGT